MFDNLSETLQGIFASLRGHTRVSEEVLDKSLARAAAGGRGAENPRPGRAYQRA